MYVCVKVNKFYEYSNDNCHCDVLFEITPVHVLFHLVSFQHLFSGHFTRNYDTKKKNKQILFYLLCLTQFKLPHKNTVEKGEKVAMQVLDAVEML